MSEEDFIKVWSQSSRESILHQFYWERKELRETIDKAIEYIESNSSWEETTEDGCFISGKLLQDDDIDYVLEILKGEDKE